LEREGLPSARRCGAVTELLRQALRSGRLLAIPVAALLALVTGAALAQPAAPWRIAALTPDTAGTRGARMPSVAADGRTVVFPHDGDLVPAGPGNPGLPGNADANTEVFAWRDGIGPGAGLAQLTATSRAMGGSPQQSRPTASGDGRRVALLSNADLDPGTGNADRTTEVFVWDTGGGFRQLSAGGPGSAAEDAMISRDGRAVAFWHTGDLGGANADRGPELYLATDGGPAAQLTRLAGQPYHSRAVISADGSRVAFVAEADLTGGNADGSWELFLWQGPATTPGDPARFTQVTDWHPPMTPRQLQDPAIGGDGRRVAFAGTGHVDASQPGGHVAYEVYLWTEGAGIARLTTATSSRDSSGLPWISDDGRHVAFVSLSDFAGRNADGSAELFAWTDGGGIAQVTDSRGAPDVIAFTPAIIPGASGDGARAAFIGEKESDPGPLVFTSRRGVAFYAVDPARPTPTDAPTPTATATPTAPAPTATVAPPNRVCPQIAGRVPPSVISEALAHPEQVDGWQQPAHPGLPPGPFNPPRRWLSLLDLGKPFGPANWVVWKAGCP